jgi:hypothetical protein
MTTQTLFQIIGYGLFVALGVFVVLFVKEDWQRRRKAEASQHEWESIQRQIREARSPEEKKVATERFVEKLKQAS